MSDVLRSKVREICGGNPGAVMVVTAMTPESDEIESFAFLRSLEDIGLTGWKIWYAFKDVCGGKPDEFRRRVNARDADMIEAVRRYEAPTPRGDHERE